MLVKARCDNRIVAFGKGISQILSRQYYVFSGLPCSTQDCTIAALEVWARRLGLNAFLVARAISWRGTAPRRFLETAFQDARNYIEARFKRALTEVVEK